MNIVILLFVGMVLIDLVIVITTQRDLIRAEISKGDMVLSRLEDDALATVLWENIGSHSECKVKIGNILSEADVSCALIMGKDQGKLYFGGNKCTTDNELLE